MDALEALHEKFNIANAAAIQLHVERVGSRGAGALLGNQAFAGLQDRLNSGKAQSGGVALGVGSTPVDVRLHSAHAFASQRLVTSGIANLDQRLKFPILSCFRIVNEQLTPHERYLTLAHLRS